MSLFKDLLNEHDEREDLFSAFDETRLSDSERKKRNRRSYESAELDSAGCTEIRVDGTVFDAFFLPEHDIVFTREARKIAFCAVHILDDGDDQPNIENIYIHDEIEEIEAGAFDEINGDEVHIYVEETSPYYMAVDDALFSKDGKRLIWISPSKEGNYDVPDGVEEIEDYVAGYYTNLDTLTVPPSVTKLPASIIEPRHLPELGDLSLRGIKGSYIEQWAAENWYDFEEVEYIPAPLQL